MSKDLTLELLANKFNFNPEKHKDFAYSICCLGDKEIQIDSTGKLPINLQFTENRVIDAMRRILDKFGDDAIFESVYTTQNKPNILDDFILVKQFLNE